MADLSVTIGADTAELEKKVKEAGKTIKDGLTPGQKGVIKGMDFAQNLMSGNVGAAIGSLFGPVGQAVGGFIDTIIGKAKELMDISIQLRAMSMQTGLTTQQIQGLENIAKATGISVGKLSDSISEFNRRVGYAQIHGGELNFLFNKLGVKMADVKNGTFNYFDAIDALAKAQAAGTDQAILNHYANVMLGSSYKELLPLIKMGSDNLKGYSQRIYKTSQESIDALTEAGDSWNEFSESVKNIAMDMLGWLYSKTFATDPQSISDAMATADHYYGGSIKNQMEKLMTEWTGGKTEAQKKSMMTEAVNIREKELVKLGRSPAEVKADIDERRKALEEMFNKKGVNLNPYGLGPAQGASTMQQMGGGDLFGAVSFNPQQETANNTKITADQITQLNSKVQPSNTANPNRDDLNK